MQALGRGGFLGWFARRPQPEGNAAEDEGAADEGMRAEWFVEDQPDQQRTQDRFQHGDEAFGSSEACIWSAIGHEPAIPRQAQGRQGPILAPCGHMNTTMRRQLSDLTRTSLQFARSAEFDPKRTSG